jgi:uncharacterized protein (DUF2235 family)
MSKNIILCADGTGQKGGYGADSNVYKLYKAVDLYVPHCKQISFYDNGVGTTENNSDSKSNKFIRALSGGFGFGFQDNVCSLYRFLAQQYEPGDNIYFFGFSRGAATVRACTGFINTCGLLDRNKVNNTDEFNARVQQALVAYQQRKKNRQLANDFKAQYALHDAEYAPEGDLKIHFVGVWDTVSALGFSHDWSLLLDPFFIGLDKLSDLFFPHLYYKYGLNKNIANAYHALSIDDARKTFHPKVWNETKPQYDAVNVEQVWFPGVHSNVGGGYPRTGLSDIAFDWMMARAAHHGLHFIPEDRAMVKVHGDATGKLFDSRDGFGCYYRYEPRNLAALCQKDDLPDNSKLRDSIKIHRSTIERLKIGFAGYAPSYLPAEFDIVETELDATGKPKAQPIRIKPEDINDWQQANDEAEGWIQKRRLIYHIFVELTFLFLVLSGVMWKYPPEALTPYLTGSAGDEVFFLFRWLHDVLLYITPVFFKNFITYLTEVQPFLTIFLAAGTYGLFKARKYVLANLQRALEKSRAVLLRNIP